MVEFAVGLILPTDRVQEEYQRVKEKIVSAYRKLREDPEFPNLDGFMRPVPESLASHASSPSEIPKIVCSKLELLSAAVPEAVFLIRANYREFLDEVYRIENSKLRVLSSVCKAPSFVDETCSSDEPSFTGFFFQQETLVSKFRMDCEITELFSREQEKGVICCTNLIRLPISKGSKKFKWRVCFENYKSGGSCPHCCH